MAAKVTIYTKLGVPRVDAYDYVYSGEFMGERKVSVEVKSPVEIEFAVGDYIILERESEVFTLQSIPVGNRVYNSHMITYNLEFWWRGYELKTINFLDYVDGTENESAYNRNTGEVVVTGTVVQLMDRIIANMNRAYSDGWYGSWNYLIDESVDTTIIKDIELQNAKCWDAVLLVNSLFELNFRIEFSDRVILVGYPPEVSTHTFEFGKGKGLCDITRLQPETALVTRVYAYGSTQNIPSDYRTGQYTNGYMPRLMLPQATYPNGYMANAEIEAAYGIREDYFIDDTIFPTIPDTMNTIDEVLPIYDAPDVDDEPPAIDSKPLTLKPFHTWYYDEFGNRVYNPQTAYDDDVTEIKYSLPTSFVSGNGMSYNEATVFIVTDLDINAPEVKGSLPAQMSFKTGQLQGTTLQINSWTREYVDGFPTDRMKVVLQRETSDIGYQLPNATVKMVAGDEFVLLNINLPNAYILDAENRLEIATQAWMDANIGEPLAYNIAVPEEFVTRTPVIYYYLREGCGIHLLDTILNVDATYLVQSVSITYRSEKLLPEYNLTISNKPIKSRFAKLEQDLKSAQQNVAAADMRIEQNNTSNLKSAYVFKQSITNNYGELLGSLIEAQSILPTALGTDLRSARYVLGAYLEVNYGGNMNSVYGSDGWLLHKDPDIVWGGVFDLEHQTWTIATPQTFTALDPLKYYWAYIKGNLTDGSATWYLSETKLLADEVEGYYMFEWGQVLPVRSGERIVQATYGATYVMHPPVTIADGSEDMLSITEGQVLAIDISQIISVIPPMGSGQYIYFAWASDDLGTDFSLTFNESLHYYAIISVGEPIVNPTAADFAGKWSYHGPWLVEWAQGINLTPYMSVFGEVCYNCNAYFVSLVNDTQEPQPHSLYVTDYKQRKGWRRIEEINATPAVLAENTFAEGNMVYRNGSAWALADANDITHAANGIVIKPEHYDFFDHTSETALIGYGADVFHVATMGFIPGDYVDGTRYYLSTTAGEIVDESTALAYADGKVLQYIGIGATRSGENSGRDVQGIILCIERGTVIGAAQVNSDWNASGTVAEILNKPTIPAAQIQSDWNQTDNEAVDFIKNKPTIPSDTDEKVKYDANDTTAGYLADKIVAGTGITIAEGTGADENKLKITNSVTVNSNYLKDWIEWEFRDIVAGTAADYVLDLKALVGYTIDSAVMQVDAGTLTVAIKIGSTSVTGLSSVAVDTDIDETTATGANTVAAGDKVILAVSSTYTGAPTLIRGKLNLTRT